MGLLGFAESMEGLSGQAAVFASLAEAFSDRVAVPTLDKNDRCRLDHANRPAIHPQSPPVIGQSRGKLTARSVKLRGSLFFLPVCLIH
jgi:hypothetical protein